MEILTLKDKRQQIRKWYLLTNAPIPEYLIEEKHLCDPESVVMDPKGCPACREFMVDRFEMENVGKQS